MRVLFLNEINKYDSIGIELLSALLKEKGHWTRVCLIPDLIENTTITLKFLKLFFGLFSLDDDKYIEYLLSFNPDVICFSAVTSYMPRAKKLAAVLRKKDPSVTLVCGGPHPTISTEETVISGYFDYVCKGEGEILLPKLIGALEEDDKSPRINGVYYSRNGEVVGEGIGDIVEDLDVLPFPDKVDVIKDYPFFERVYMVNSMRSCAYSCTYCGSPHFRKEYSKFGKKVYRRKSPLALINELKYAKKRYPKIKTVGFVDDTLTMGKEWINEFAELYEKHIKIPFFGCTNPILLKDEDLIIKLKKAGLIYIEIGIQALDEKFRMETVKRPDSDKDIFECAQLLQKHNIYIQANHIFGLDKRDYSDHDFLKRTVDYYLKLRPNRTHCFELEYLPGAEIVQNDINNGYFSNSEYKKILNGEKSVAYNFGGSIEDVKIFIPYITLLEMRPFLPEIIIRFLMNNKLCFWFVKKIPISYLVLARMLNTIIHPRDVEGKPHYRKYIDGMFHIRKIKKT